MPQDLDTLGALFGGAGIFDEQFFSGPQTDAANQAQFDTAEGRNLDLRTGILGNPQLQNVPQAIVDRARENGQVIVERSDGTFITVARGPEADALAFQSGGQILEPGSASIGEISQAGIQGFQDVRDNTLQRFGDLESTIIPGFQNREQSILGDFANLQSGLNATAQGRVGTGMDMIQQLMANLQGGFGQLQSDIGGQFGRLQSDVGAGFTGLQSGVAGGFNRLQSGVQGGFGQLRGDLLGTLQGAGAQERIDINETFDNLGDATRAGLIESGLSGSTVLPSLQADVARQRTGAQGRLDERLRQQQLGVIGDTGFGALNAQQNIGLNQLQAQQGLGVAGLGAQQNIGLSGLGAQQNIGLSGLASQQGLGQFGANMFAGLSGDALNLASSLGIFGTGLQGQLSGDTLGAQQNIGQFGIGLDAATGIDLANAGVNFGQLPFGFDIGLTGSEVGLDLSQMTQQGVSFLTQLGQFFSSISQPDTPKQSSATENFLLGGFG